MVLQVQNCVMVGKGGVILAVRKAWCVEEVEVEVGMEGGC